MSAKMGRPTDDPKISKIGIRLTATEMQLLNYCADKLGITRTEVITKGVRIIKSQLDADLNKEKGR